LLKFDIVLYKRKNVFNCNCSISLPLVVKVMIISNIKQGDIFFSSYFLHWLFNKILLSDKNNYIFELPTFFNLKVSVPVHSSKGKTYPLTFATRRIP